MQKDISYTAMLISKLTLCMMSQDPSLSKFGWYGEPL